MSPLRSAVTLPAVVVGVVTLVVALLVGLGLPVAVAAGILLTVSFARVTGRRALRVLRRSLKARPALVGEFPRLHNTVGGLCLTHGIQPPELFVIDSPAGNAAAMAGPDGQSIVLTTGAADRLGLVELETTAAAMGRLAGIRLVAVASVGPDRVMQADLDGAEWTRFPPGMQTALRGLADLGTEVDASVSTSRLWLLQPDGRTDVQTTSHPTVEVRVAALGER